MQLNRVIQYCLFVFLLLNSRQIYAQIEIASDTVPYVLIKNKMIIEAKINGIRSHFIFDTGGKNIITVDSANARSITAAGSEVIRDGGNQQSTLIKGQVANFTVGNLYHKQNMPMLIMGRMKYFEDLGVSGLLGGEAFSGVCIQILPRQQVLVFTHPYRPIHLNRNDALPMNTGSSSHAYIPLKIRNITQEVLFDTGVDGFFLLAASELPKLENEGVQLVDSAYGIPYVGLSGPGAYVTSYRAVLPTVAIGDKTFDGVRTVTMAVPRSILGIELLQYGDVTLDYPRSAFYFTPYESTNTTVASPLPDWEVQILPMNGRFEISNIWSAGKGKVELGEPVSSINGQSLIGVENSEFVIRDLMNATANGQLSIVVGEKGKERNVQILKMK